MTREYEAGDPVRFVAGEHEGHHGIVEGFEEVFERYYVSAPDITRRGFVAAKPEELAHYLEEEPESEEDEKTIPTFGLSKDEFARQMEIFLHGCLGEIGEVDTRDAFFSFQEFEGKDPQEVLLELLTKLEQSVVFAAQAHILITRMIAAYSITVEDLR